MDHDRTDHRQDFAQWQVANFGSTNNPSAAASADPDNDGANNYYEFLTMTPPLTALLCGKLISPTRAPTLMSIICSLPIAASSSNKAAISQPGRRGMFPQPACIWGVEPVGQRLGSASWRAAVFRVRISEP